MQKTLYLVLLGAIVLLSVASTQAQIVVSPEAQSAVTTDASVDRVAYLEQKIANLECSLADCSKDTIGCVDSCCAPCGNPGIIGGYDVIWFKPHFADAMSCADDYWTGPDDADVVHPLSGDYEFAPRFWLGYETASGLGARVTYWQFDQQIASGHLAPGGPPGPDQVYIVYTNHTDDISRIDAGVGSTFDYLHGMEMHVLDCDVTQKVNWGRTNATLGGGVRYAKLLFTSWASVDAGTWQTVNVENTFEGVGPTVALDLQHPIGQTRISLVGAVRGTVLFGRGRWQEYWDNVNAGTTHLILERGNRTVGVIEGNIGLQYNRALRRGVDAIVRFSWEGQLWIDSGSPTNITDDMAMEGLSVAFGITR